MFNNQNTMGGGAMDDSRASLYDALSQQGLLGEMSFEEFQSLPPQHLRQLMQGIRQQMQMGGDVQAPTMGPSGQLMNGTGSGGANIGGDGVLAPRQHTGMGRQFQGQPELNNQPTQQKKGVNQGLVNAGIMGGSQLVGGFAGMMKNNKKSAGSTENVAGDIVGGAAEGAATGAAFGPWGALIGAGVGGVMGGINNSQAQTKENTLMAERQQAENVGSLGTQLNPEVAAYGTRIAERSLVNTMKNRADNPNLYEGNYSYKNKAGSGVSRAGFNDGHYFNDRPNAQNGANIPSHWSKPVKPQVIFDEYFKSPWDRSNKFSDYKRAENAKYAEIMERNKAKQAAYDANMNVYNQDMTDLGSLANMYHSLNNAQGPAPVYTPENDLYRTAGHAGNPYYRESRQYGGPVQYGMGGGYSGKKWC